MEQKQPIEEKHSPVQEQKIENVGPAIKKKNNTPIIVLILAVLGFVFCACCGVATFLISKNSGNAPTPWETSFKSITTDTYTFYYPDSFTERTDADPDVTHSYVSYDFDTDSAVVINFWEKENENDDAMCYEYTNQDIQLAYALLMEADTENVTILSNESFETDTSSGCVIEADIFDGEDTMHLVQKYIFRDADTTKTYLVALLSVGDMGEKYTEARTALTQTETR